MKRPSGENVTSVCSPGANVKRVSVHDVQFLANLIREPRNRAALPIGRRADLQLCQRLAHLHLCGAAGAAAEIDQGEQSFHVGRQFCIDQLLINLWKVAKMHARFVLAR